MAWEGSTRAARLPGNWRTIRRFVLQRDRRTCRIRLPGCTLHASDVDHIADPDDHDPANLQAACSWCNQRKNILTRTQRASRRRPAETHPGLIHEQQP